jgi:hypothetical protein
MTDDQKFWYRIFLIVFIVNITACITGIYISEVVQRGHTERTKILAPYVAAQMVSDMKNPKNCHKAAWGC